MSEMVLTEMILTPSVIPAFTAYLRSQEKSALTIEKYVRDTRAFLRFADGRPLAKELVLDYKTGLVASGKYGNGSINSMLASVNSLLRFLGREDCRASNIRIQGQPYCPEEKSLGKSEYLRLREAARGDSRLYLVLDTLFGTGIRVSELRFFTVEALRSGTICVSCKNKTRAIVVPAGLRKKLLFYAGKNKIRSGVIFRSRNGNPLDRSNLWAQMKRLCEKANVKRSKVFPHNLRKLFARLLYERSHDIAQLACLLGHSSINTTRIYVMTTESEVRRKVEDMVDSVLTDEKSTTLSA